MKKLVLTLVVLATFTLNASAMSYEQAREQALFLTDKMAYELNLTPDQYDAAYEINLDYLMGVSTADDVFNDYWTRRNLDLSYVLLDWQYRMFCDALYFYRPLYWDAGLWHFRIYARYPHRGWFYFDRPRVYVTYRGEHCWRNFGDRGYYHGRVFARAAVGTSNHSRARIEGGMRDNWNGKGRNFGNNDRSGNGINHGTSGFNRGNGSFNRGNYGSNRNNNNMSSTRETVTSNRSTGNGGFNQRHSATTTTQTTRTTTSTRSVGSSRSNVTGSSYRGSSSASRSSGFGSSSRSSSMSRGSFGSGHSGGGRAAGGFGHGGHR